VKLKKLMRSFWLQSIFSFSLLCYASSDPGQNGRSLKLDRHDLTVLGVTLGSSTLAQVESKLGKAMLFKIGRKEEADKAVCYRSVSNEDDTILVFYFGALGGWTDVTQISVSKSRALPWSTARCVSNSSVSRNLEVLRKLKLGSLTADVVRVLGSPSRTAKNGLSYYFSHHCESEMLQGSKEGETPSRDSQCEVVDSVEAKFTAEDGLIYLSFYHFVDR